jgi:hypothetical protein
MRDMRDGTVVSEHRRQYMLHEEPLLAPLGYQWLTPFHSLLFFDSKSDRLTA